MCKKHDLNMGQQGIYRSCHISELTASTQQLSAFHLDWGILNFHNTSEDTSVVKQLGIAFFNVCICLVPHTRVDVLILSEIIYFSYPRKTNALKGIKLRSPGR